MTRADRVMAGAARWASYYRHNPHRFCKDYLHLDLKLFQKILIVMMNVSTIFVFIACRGIGKTFLAAVFAVTRCTLWPGTKIVIASGVRSQSLNLLEKVMLELVPNSPELAAELDMKQTTINGTKAQIVWKNGSFIKVVTASDSSRGSRANVLILDEFRLISKDVIDTVLRKFLTQRRMPRYAELSNEGKKAEYDKEKNMTMYLSSAFWADSWAYTKCQDTAQFMLDDTKRQFICGLPYQLSIAEGLLDKETVESELCESDFSATKFSMEYEALWWGVGDGSFFDFNSVSKNRKIHYPMLPSDLARRLNNHQKVRILPKQNGEIRIISADIALMSSKKHDNDATAIFVTQLMPNKAGRHTANVVYTTSAEGMRTEEQALMIRKLYDEYACDYIVLDTNGIGLGVFDALARDIVDVDTGEVYPALSCCNDSAMADRCTVAGADKVIWSIKASAAMNSDCAVLLREGFRSGKIRLLVTEYDAEELLKEIPGYSKLSPAEQLQFQLPYIHTTLLIDELIKLQHEENNGKIKISERSGMRKDRYSSLAYNYYVATQLESKLSRRRGMNTNFKNQFMYRAPKIR